MRNDLRLALTPAQRLIVAADFKPEGPGGIPGVRRNVLDLADKLGGSGVCLKVNSALLACGYGLIDEIHCRDLTVFADLKRIDIRETLETDGMLLRESRPEFLTVMCGASLKAMTAIKAMLPNTEVLGVTILTDLEDEEVEDMFRRDTTSEAVVMKARRAMKAGLNGLISSGAEAAALRALVGDNMTINTPAIRPSWAQVKADDQNKARAMTPAEAIRAGADRVVIGRPILQADDPLEAVKWSIDEIAEAVG